MFYGTRYFDTGLEVPPMAKTNKIRVHLVIPEEEDNQGDNEAETVGVCPECGGELLAETHLS